MVFLGRISGVKAGLLGLLVLGLSACATNPMPAPITYGNRPPPIVASPRPTRPPADPSAPAYDASATPVVVTDQPPSECVPFARTESGVQIYGDAVTWWAQADGKYPRSGIPAEGSVLVLRGWNDDRRGHVAVVRSIVSERMIRIDQANWLHQGEISLNVPVADVSPDNDWSEVRVWNVPAGTWGSRTYLAQGFIHPIGPIPPPYDPPAAPPAIDPATGQPLVG
ncbi:MAG TPA: CHAP domain-containing protein [Candidatus Polarisedimenticolia bacterium]|nr:CHAP domain-containing protein [Candidatus Polarisedimenticolia bacterium]